MDISELKDKVKNNKDANAAYELGKLYESKENYKEALEYYEIALNLGHPAAPLKLDLFPINLVFLNPNDKKSGCTYGKHMGGLQYQVSGVESALQSIRSDSPYFLKKSYSMNPNLDWGNNLFIEACKTKKYKVIQIWETCVPIEHYGWVYGFENALMNEDQILIKWFESQTSWKSSDIQEHLKNRCYDARNHRLREYFNKS